MIIIADNKYDYYLCNEFNSFYLSPYKPKYSWYDEEEEVITYSEIYAMLEGYELGSFDYIFNEAKLFEHIIINNLNAITPTDNFKNYYHAFIRDIKIENIINDIFDD
jgi:hypothetical protein